MFRIALSIVLLLAWHPAAAKKFFAEDIIRASVAAMLGYPSEDVWYEEGCIAPIARGGIDSTSGLPRRITGRHPEGSFDFPFEDWVVYLATIYAPAKYSRTSPPLLKTTQLPTSTAAATPPSSQSSTAMLSTPSTTASPLPEQLPSLALADSTEGSLHSCTPSPTVDYGMHQLLWARLGPLGYCPCNDGLNIGVDLRSAYDMRVPAFGNAIIWTNIALQFPPGTYGRIADRSGMASQNSITVGGGVIDPGYRGNIGVILFNHGAREYGVKRGDKVCQILCECAVIPTICEVGELAGTTARGESGFGSSGR